MEIMLELVDNHSCVNQEGDVFIIVTIILGIVSVILAVIVLFLLASGIWFGLLGSHESRAREAGSYLKAYDPTLYEPKWFNRKGNSRHEYLEAVKEKGLSRARKGYGAYLENSGLAKVGDKEAMNVYRTSYDSVKKAKDEADQSLIDLYSQKDKEPHENTEAENESQIFDWQPVRPSKTKP